MRHVNVSIRYLEAEAKAKGMTCYPVCDNYGLDGRCLGHENEVGGAQCHTQ